MKNYCYKVKHKFLKVRPDGSRDIENYFHKYISHDSQTGFNEEIYAIAYRLRPESAIVRGFVSLCNDPKWQKAAKIEENIDEFAKQGLCFSEVVDADGSGRTFVLQEDEDSLKDFEMVRLCVDLIDEETFGYLFILLSDGHTLYYNAKVIEEHMPEIIKGLIEDDVIYKKAIEKKAKHPRNAGQNNVNNVSGDVGHEA